MLSIDYNKEFRMATKSNPRQPAREEPEQEDEVQTVQRFYPESRPNKLAGMEIGECDALAARLDMDTECNKEMIEYKTNLLKSVMSKAADTASKRTGYKFKTETGMFMTNSRDMIIVVTVTRMS